MNTVLLIGSAPDALRAREWSRRGFDSIVAINNAWQIREDWDYHIYPDDMAADRLPDKIKPHQQTITSDLYVDAQNHFGGFIYAGGTMAFTAAYWALAILKPKILVFVGCDMIYPENKPTHFYGQGAKDPLRDDITLQSLEAKANRLQIMALENDCVCLNVSSLTESRLVFPKAHVELFFNEDEQKSLIELKNLRDDLKKQIESPPFNKKLLELKNREKELDYFVENGKYWQSLDSLDADKLKKLDDLWLSLTLNC